MYKIESSFGSRRHSTESLNLKNSNLVANSANPSFKVLLKQVSHSPIGNKIRNDDNKLSAERPLHNRSQDKIDSSPSKFFGGASSDESDDESNFVKKSRSTSGSDLGVESENEENGKLLSRFALSESDEEWGQSSPSFEKSSGDSASDVEFEPSLSIENKRDLSASLASLEAYATDEFIKKHVASSPEKALIGAESRVFKNTDDLKTSTYFSLPEGSKERRDFKKEIGSYQNKMVKSGTLITSKKQLPFYEVTSQAGKTVNTRTGMAKFIYTVENVKTGEGYETHIKHLERTVVSTRQKIQ